MVKFVKFRYAKFVFLCAGAAGLAMVWGSGQGDASAMITADQCCRCHTEVCAESASRRYVHPPVREEHCAVCHVKGGLPAKDDNPQSQDESPATNWFARDCLERPEHWFELPVGYSGTTVALLAIQGGNDVIAQEVVLPKLDTVPSFPDFSGVPQISELQVLEVRKGVFLSATITWKTDRITDAQIFYGENDFKASTALDNQWARHHELTITGLAADKSYQFIAVSRDIYGNTTRSTPTELSTRNFFSRSQLWDASSNSDIDVVSSFYRFDDRLFAQFATSQPVTMRLGTNGEAQERAAAEPRNPNLPLEHVELTDYRSLSLTVCVGCHPNSKGELSHPVDIRPKAGMLIPPDYRTMADGRLSCMSCHQPHASDHEYRLTRQRRKDLCLGCHRNFG